MSLLLLSLLPIHVEYTPLLSTSIPLHIWIWRIVATSQWWRYHVYERGHSIIAYYNDQLGG